MEANCPDWFRNTIGRGLQELRAIGLPNTPAADIAKLTAQAWVQALWGAPRGWLSEDSDRLLEAFRAASRRVDRWPTPNEVLSLLAARPDIRKKLNAFQMSDEQRLRNLGRVKAVLSTTLKRVNDS